MSKMSFSEFMKYVNAYEQYLALPEDEKPKDEKPKDEKPDWQSIETSLAEILKRMDAAPKPSIDDVKPETVDDVLKKILI